MHWMLMPLRRYAEFSGRSRRKEYWMWVLLNAIVGSVIGVLGAWGASSRLFSSDEEIALYFGCTLASGRWSPSCPTWRSPSAGYTT